MTSKENYFPPNTDINTVNDTLYTDYSFLDSHREPERELLGSECDSASETEISLEPPF